MIRGHDIRYPFGGGIQQYKSMIICKEFAYYIALFGLVIGNVMTPVDLSSDQN